MVLSNPTGLQQLVVIVALTLVVRLCFVLTFDHQPVSDERAYDELALHLASTGTYAVEGKPTAYRPVGYPAFLALLYVLFGHSITAARVVQAILDTSVSLGLFFLAGRYGVRNGILAAGLWGVYVPGIIYSGLLLSETLAVSLLVWSFVLFAHPRPLTLSRGVLGGVLAGIIILIKPWTTLFYGPLFLFLSTRSSSTRPIILAMAVTFLITGAWMARNLKKLDTLAISTNAGLNLYIGNNPDATGAYHALSASRFDGSPNEAWTNRTAAIEAITYIASNPMDFAVGFFRKTAHLLRTEGELLVIAFHGSPEDRATSFLQKYSQVPLVLVVLVNLPFIVVLTVGTYSLFAPSRDDLMFLIAWLVAVVFLVHGIFFGGSRFHFPLMPFLAVLSARVIPSIRKSWTELDLLRRFSFLVIIALLIGLWAYEYFLVSGL